MSIAVNDEINQMQDKEEETYYVPPPRAWLVDEQEERLDNNCSSNNNKQIMLLSMDHDGIDDVSYVSHNSNVSMEFNKDPEEILEKEEEEEDITCQVVKTQDNMILENENDDFVTNNSAPQQPLVLHKAEKDTTNNNENKVIPIIPKTATLSIPQTTKDLFTSMVHKSIYYSRLFYTYQIKKQSRHTDLGSGIGGFPVNLLLLLQDEDDKQDGDDLETTNTKIFQNLPPFSSLSWINRQLVQEWRSIEILSDTSITTTKTATSKDNIINNDDEDDDECCNDYELAQRLIPRAMKPKSFSNASYCHSCHKSFYSKSGCIVLTRHHCRLCCHSFCQEDSAYTHVLPHLGYDVSMPQRVCTKCKELLDKRDLKERIAWKLCRIRDYLKDDLTPYFEIGVDTLEDILSRLAQYTIQITRQLPCLLLGAQATVAVETVEILRRHGLHAFYGILLRQEFLQAADLLCKVAGINEDVWPLKSVHELSAAIFYALAENRYKRGINPAFEEQQHSQEYCSPIPNSTLSSILFYAPLALHFIYVPNIIDMQLLAAQQNWVVLYANLDHMKEDYPANALYVHSYEKIAVLAIRGTTTVQDVVTDIRAMPVPFPEHDNVDSDDSDDNHVMIPSGLALQGMVRAAYNLYKENRSVILRLVKCGYKIRFIGHSLGGGVSALLGILFKADFLLMNSQALDNPNDFQLPSGSEETWLHVYAYGCPACINKSLSTPTNSFITSIILHDDIVPRLTPTYIRKLMKHLLYIRETWVKEHFENDVRDIKTRCFNVWSPRWRGSFVLLKDNKTHKMKNSKEKAAVTASRNTMLPTIPWQEEPDQEEKHDTIFNQSQPLPSDNTIKHENNSMYYHDGEFFLDALDYVIENGEDESLNQELSDTVTATTQEQTPPLSSHGSSSSSTYQEEEQPLPAMTDTSDINTTLPSKEDQELEEESSILLLEETPLPNMFIPGKIIHIYTHNGGYKATFVPPTFSELRQISLAPNMLTDHITQSYYEALLEVKSIRQSPSTLPTWTGFSSSSTCACCASSFTWASTCKSTAQEARDKHNCYGCGALVCHPCSTNRIPMQKYGIMVPVRVCDKCYYNCDFNFRDDDDYDYDGEDNDHEQKEDHQQKQLQQKQQNALLKKDVDNVCGDWRRKNHNLVNDLVERISCHAAFTNAATTSPSSSVSMSS